MLSSYVVINYELWVGYFNGCSLIQLKKIINRLRKEKNSLLSKRMFLIELKKWIV